MNVKCEEISCVHRTWSWVKVYKILGVQDFRLSLAMPFGLFVKLKPISSTTEKTLRVLSQ